MRLWNSRTEIKPSQIYPKQAETETKPKIWHQFDLEIAEQNWVEPKSKRLYPKRAEAETKISSVGAASVEASVGIQL